MITISIMTLTFCKFYTYTFDKLVLKVYPPLYVANADPPRKATRMLLPFVFITVKNC